MAAMAEGAGVTEGEADEFQTDGFYSFFFL
jgi:hypothetical protein